MNVGRADAGLQTGRRARVDFLVCNLPGTPIVRAAPLAAALAADHDVGMLGLLRPTESVYRPYRDQNWALRTVAGGRLNPLALLRLSQLVGGDVVIACKPLPESLVPALLAARRRRIPLVVDIEDDEWADSPVDGAGPVAMLRRWATLHRAGLRAVHPLLRFADAVTVSSRALQRRYGGTLIRHGPDESIFAPPADARAHRAATRARFGLPQERRLAVFCGVPRAHKGWPALVEALQQPEAAEWDLVAAGAPVDRWYDVARTRLGKRFHAVGLLERHDVAALLAAADAAPVPQEHVPLAESQLPAKLLEAMAVGTPAIGTDVGDLPEILGHGARGLVVPAGSAVALAGALAAIGGGPVEAQARAQAARAWFLAEASVAANRARLGGIVAGLLTARAAAPPAPAVGA